MPLPSGNVVMFQILQQRHLLSKHGAIALRTTADRVEDPIGRTIWNFQVLCVFQPLKKKNGFLWSCKWNWEHHPDYGHEWTININISEAIQYQITAPSHGYFQSHSSLVAKKTNSFVGPLNSPTTKHIMFVSTRRHGGVTPTYKLDKPGCGSKVLT